MIGAITTINLLFVQVILSCMLGIYGIWHLKQYYDAARRYMSSNDRTDRLLMAAANLALSMANALVLLLNK